MGAIIGVVIFVAIIYYIFKYFENVERGRYDKILDTCYNELKDNFDNVEKVKDGFTWESNIDGLTHNRCQITITVEHKNDARDVFVNKKNENNFGLLIRYFEKEGLENRIYDYDDLKKFSSQCDGNLVQPWYVLPVKVGGIQHVCYSIFIPADDQLAGLLERNIERNGAPDALHRFLYKLFYESFQTGYLRHYLNYRQKLDEYYQELYSQSDNK
ncbi:MAG: hypothetical protein KH115_02775 [Veillonella sp.]|uniref:hypothetical protein n=1 Tax=Veillonella sp. TaxID=1926307 RepID=UPI001DF39439|nr:hypothetical protein [Veillonella sp.]MBS7014243.1 hypothetical protein [Veillonella sp.]